MKNLFKSKKAAIATTIVIVISTILLASGLNLILGNIDLTQSALGYKSSVVKDVITTSCLEESVYRLRQDRTYTGTFTLEFVDGDCDSTITQSGTGAHTVSITGNYYNLNETVSYEVNTNMYPYSVTPN